MNTPSLKILFLSAIAAIVVIGCGPDKKGQQNSVQCDQFGCYDRNGYIPGANGNFYGNLQGVNSKTIMLSGAVTVQNNDAWQKVVKGLGACGQRNTNPYWFQFDLTSHVTCHLRDEAPPQINVSIEDPAFTNNASWGTVTISSLTAGVYPKRVPWWRVNGESKFKEFEAQFHDQYNRLIRVKITANDINDSQVVVEFSINGAKIGEGYLIRQQHYQHYRI